MTAEARWLDHLAAERGLAVHSLAAYGRDLKILQASLGDRSLVTAGYDDLTVALRGLRAAGRSPRSVARPAIGCCSVRCLLARPHSICASTQA